MEAPVCQPVQKKSTTEHSEHTRGQAKVAKFPTGLILLNSSHTIFDQFHPDLFGTGYLTLARA
ncbi:MAG: hypothetical protein CMJ81_11430 [Planctomycetaceae bacterium]|nr:hypothetical protein [Planctomycetaceae bacterium]MBP61700.1 hypothetical protein [Planctomycetaceae bacterium]